MGGIVFRHTAPAGPAGDRRAGKRNRRRCARIHQADRRDRRLLPGRFLIAHIIAFVEAEHVQRKSRGLPATHVGKPSFRKGLIDLKVTCDSVQAPGR